MRCQPERGLVAGGTQLSVAGQDRNLREGATQQNRKSHGGTHGRVEDKDEVLKTLGHFVALTCPGKVELACPESSHSEQRKLRKTTLKDQKLRAS
jgi:hypothetical protein